MNLLFQTAVPEHIPTIYSQAKALIDTYEDKTAIDYEKVMGWLMRKIRLNIGEYTCVRLDNTVCAFYRLCPDGEVDDLYVLPAFRGKGIGSAILKRCIAASDKGLYLYVFSKNTAALAFYDKHGFSCRESVGATRLILERKG